MAEGTMIELQTTDQRSTHTNKIQRYASVEGARSSRSSG